MDWPSGASLPPLLAVVGVDLDQRLVFGADTAGALQGLDLEGRAVLQYLEPARLHTVGPDGTLYAISPDRKVVQLARRVATTFPPRLAGRPVQLAGTLGNQVVVVTESGDSLLAQIVSQDRATNPVSLPKGEVAVTAWGDLIAVAAGGAVVLVGPPGRNETRRVAVGGVARRGAVTPSGHRL